MPSPRATLVPAAAVSPWRTGATALLLVLAVTAVYWNSLDGPFQFDDGPAVLYNPTIGKLWPPWTALQPPANGAGVTGRPVVNLSLAVNHAIGGLDPRGYHVMNMALHALAVLALWGILRRTAPRVPGLPQPEAWAAGVALLWAVHPLLTESVVGVVQRNEILGGLFYLLTLYGFIRAVEIPPANNSGHSERSEESMSARAPQPSRPWILRFAQDDSLLWQGVAVVACLLGVASKEIVATAPLMVLLYDRTFVAGSIAAAWRERKGFYLSLAATWLLLAWLMLGGNQRGGSVGFGLGMSSWDYLLTQCRALTLYLHLAVVPYPLVVDYGQGLSALGDVWWRGLIILGLLGATGWALVRRPAWGCVGAWFFVILAPSSSFVPLTTQTIAEHRMYLPLIAVLAAAMAGLVRLAGRKSLPAAGLLAVGLGAVTVQRNRVYASELALWSDTVAQAPGNPRAHLNLGQALFKAGQLPAAAAEFQAALRLKPDYPDAHYNLGLVQNRQERPAEAIAEFEAVLRQVPDHAPAHNDLGIALALAGRTGEAEAEFAAALRYRPDFSRAHHNLARLLLRTHRPAEAVPHFEAAIRLNPEVAESHSYLAVALMQTKRVPEAIAQYQEALRLEPGSPEIHLSLGLALAAANRLQEAIPQVETALRLRPDFDLARRYLSQMQADLKRIDAATSR